MAITPPIFKSKLSQPFQANNFTPVQSAQLAVTASSGSIIFTDLPGTLRVTAKISNTGTKNCYVATGAGSAMAVVSSSTPTPANGTGAVATCDCIPAGAILTQDYVQGTTTFAAICGGSDSTTLEISVGYGQ